MTNNSKVIDQETTNGQFFVNVYSDGTFGAESINGEEIRGTPEDFMFLFQALVPRLRSSSR